MKVSIIIPCYNNAPHLPKCIESVLSQSFTDFELLLLNDGSTDATLSICEDFQKKDARIKVHSHENKGVSYTRNQGIAMARGEFIMFVDGDDWIENDMIEVLMESNPSLVIMPVCGMIHERRGEVFANDFFQNLINEKKLEFNKDEIFSLFPSAVLSSPCCKIYSRIILIENNIKFDEKLSYQEDLIFNLKYLKYVQKIKIIAGFKYHYVEHLVSSSNKFHPNLEKSVFTIQTLLSGLPDYSDTNKRVQQFNVDQILKLLSNATHKDSGLTIYGKWKTTKKVLDTPFFKESTQIIIQMRLRKILKYFLINKNAIGILSYFELNKLLKKYG